MGMSIIEQHFKDEADRNNKAARDANYQIGALRYGKEYAERHVEHFKMQFLTAFGSLQSARDSAYSLASEIADELGSDSSISKQAYAIADKIDEQIQELLSSRFHVIDAISPKEK